MAIRIRGLPLVGGVASSDITRSLKPVSLTVLQLREKRCRALMSAVPLEGAVNLLTIDFDYWYCGDDKEHRHCGWCRVEGGSLEERPETMTVAIPRSLSTITHQMLIRRCRKGTPIYVTECHADVVEVLKRVKDEDRKIKVWNVDAHDDLAIVPDGIDLPLIYCGNWSSYAKSRKLLDEYCWIYSEPQLEGMPTPDIIHVCKSSPFLHRSGDKPLITFIKNLEKKSGREAEVFGYGSQPIEEALRRRK